MSGHTKGPWEVCDRATNAYWFAGKTICHGAEGGIRVADVCDLNGNWEANARLIAAAPDLLDVLDDAVSSYALSPELHKRALAAIAKATGEGA